MELEVFSDPIWGIGGRPGIGVEDLSLAAEYDEQIVKPALLLADHVVLRTWRRDVQHGEELAVRRTRLGLPLQAAVEGLVKRRSGRELELLGITPVLYPELELVVERHLGTALKGPLADEGFYSSEAVLRFVELNYQYHQRNYWALAANNLTELVKQTVLDERPWDDRSHRNFVEDNWHHNNTSFEYGWDSMVASLEAGSSGVLLDHGIESRLRAVSREVEYASTKGLSNATDLMGIVSGLSEAPIDEVVSLREELREYLVPFRAFILAHASGMDVAPEAPLGERRRQALIKWESEVAPAVAELRATVASNSFGKNLTRISAEGPEAAIGVGLGLTTALASGAVGITALAGLGTAALPVIIKATAATLQARASARQNGAYFIYEFHRRLQERRGGSV